MKSQQVLYLTDHQLIAYRFRNRELAGQETFPATAEGQQRFSDYVGEAPHRLTYLLADTRQEEYQLDAIPRVAARDRKDLIRLRLGRMFLNTPYAHAVFHGRQRSANKDQREEERMLFLGINDPEWAAPWIKALLAHQVPLKGFYSLPLLTESLLKVLPAAPYRLVVGHTPQTTPYSDFGLRQTFFVRDKLKLSRLIPLDALSLETYRDTVYQETVSTQRYLGALNLLPVDQPLHVILLPPAELDPDALAAYFQQRRNPDVEYTLVSPVDVARKLGIRHFPPPFFFNLLIAQQLVAHPPANHYARFQETRYHVYRQLRLGLYAATGVAALAGLAIGGWEMAGALEVQSRAERAARDTEAMRRRYEQAQKSKEIDAQVKVIHIKNTVDSARYLLENRLTPRQAMVPLSQALADFPRLVVARLEWEAKEEAIPTEKVEQTQVKSRFAKLRRPSATKKTQLYHQLRLFGRVEPFTGDYTQALDMVRNFTRHLREIPGVTDVFEQKLPLTINPEQEITSQNGSARSVEGEAPFILDIRFDEPRT